MLSSAQCMGCSITRTKTSIRYAKENDRIERRMREIKGKRRGKEREGDIREREREK